MGTPSSHDTYRFVVLLKQPNALMQSSQHQDVSDSFVDVRHGAEFPR